MKHCENCLKWLRNEDGDTRRGTCRHNPPVVVELGKAVQPATRDVDFCGQWEPDPEGGDS